MEESVPAGPAAAPATTQSELTSSGKPKRQRGRPPTAHLRGGKGVKRIRKSSSSGDGSSKAKPLTTYEIVAAILGKMSTRDPMTVAELCSHIANASRENIHIVVDILAILGVLMQVRLKDPPKTVNATSSGRGGYHASRVHYALNGYLRSPTPIANVANLSELVEAKLKSIEKITARNKELQNMNFDFPSRTPEEVSEALVAFVLATLERTPELRTDPLYLHVARLLKLDIPDNEDPGESDGE